MNNYIIITDTACDIRPETLAEWGVTCLDLTFRFDGDEKEYFNGGMDVKTFYTQMKEGGVAKTSAINMERFRLAFEEHLSQGTDILYLGFSGGLSTTYNSARLAAEDLRGIYPDRKLIITDTLAASAGQGLLVYLTLQKKNEGASIEEAAEYAAKIIPHLSHWFTVDDLVYLKRGGRVSPAVAFVGNTLGLKPILHVDNEGHLISKAKVRGRKNSLAALADKYGELAEDKAGGTVFISHADCEEDAKLLAKQLNETYGAKVSIITDIGPVIGAHSGPGTLALFFVGKER